jgi:type VI secretion system secreted protein VgrG
MTANNLEVHVASNDALDVRHFAVQDGMSQIFSVALTAVSKNPNIDFDGVVGKDATFRLRSSSGSGDREWHGLCSNLLQVGVEENGVSTYQITIVPTLWLLTQRRNHRIFQQLSEIEIVQKLLGEWGITPEMKLTGTYKKRKYKVQYAESDFDFLSRLLEDVGVSFHFKQEAHQTKLVLNDAPQKNDTRVMPLPFIDRPNHGETREHVTGVTVHQRVRPGKFTVRDHDYRLPPSYPLKGEHQDGQGVETKLERFHYEPGAFLFRSESGDATPHADDKGKSRSDEKEAQAIAKKRLASKRSESKRTTFHSNAMDLAAGTVLRVMNHPRSDVGDMSKHLVLNVGIHGDSEGELDLSAEAVSADLDYHPPTKTEKPKIQGVESATIVGPAGEEIHTDEFGRVRVQFHWDREGKFNEDSSCWIHTSQPWGGSGYGGSNLPRVGQEVLVDFLGGDPDRPIITGRVYTNLQKTPYKLPDNKTQSGWKSNSTGGGGGYNEMMFEDAQGKELVRMQAERNMDTLVKNDQTHTVLANHTSFVGGNNTERVNKDEALTVTGDRGVTVMKSMTHTVKTDITTTAQEGNTSFETKLTFQSHAETHAFSSDVKLTVSVGGASTIYITKDYIILNAPKVLINPGADAVAAAQNGQPLPPSDAEKAAQDKAAADAAAKAEAAKNPQAEEPMQNYFYGP